MTSTSRLTPLEVTLLVGAVLVVLFTLVSVDFGELIGSPGWLLLIPASVLMARFPMYLDRSGAWLAVGLDAAILAFAVSVLSIPHALLLWSVAAVSQCLPWDRRFKVFNTSLTIVAGGVACGLLLIIPTPPTGSPAEYLALIAALSAYFVIDVGLSEWSAGTSRGQRVGIPHLASLLRLSTIFLTVVTMAYLAALAADAVPVWATGLLIAPAAILMLLGHDGTRERETARRLALIYETTQRMYAADADDEVLEALDDGIRQINGQGNTRRDSIPPGPGEVGRPLMTGNHHYWVVLETTVTPAVPALADGDALSIITRGAEEALSRLRLSRELLYSAEHDPLTSLTQRTVFLKRVEAAIAGLDGEGERCVVMFCDLDGFKRVNDWFGHAAGDQTLIDVGNGLRESLPSEITVARLGGDEFAILIDRIVDEAHVESVVDAVRSVVSLPFGFGHRSVQIGISIGVAYSDGQHTADQLLRNADIAMYEAKWSGKNRVVEYHPSLGRARVRVLELVERLRKAIQAKELSVVYQPMFRSDTGQVRGVEILARWIVDGEPVPPETFIAAAEQSDLIIPLGESVLEQVRRDASVLRDRLGPGSTVAVNVSATEMRSESFVDSVLRTRDALRGLTLVLEITEREVISDEVLSSSVMERLIDEGIVFCVDDFGVGFSSIGYLQQLPVAELKTDRFFSSMIESDARAEQLLKSMISMGLALGLTVTVEGIERVGQLEALDEIVSEHGDRFLLQGFLLGRPMGLSELVRWLDTRSIGLERRRFELGLPARPADRSGCDPIASS